ncbi:MAG: agmatinase [bacterium]
MEFADDTIKKLDGGPATHPGFLGLPPEFSAPERARFVVIPVPFEETTSYGKGAARGPGAIIEASHQVELHDVEIAAEAFREGIHTDTALLDDTPTGERIVGAVEEVVGKWLDAGKPHRGKLPVVLGGEHTVSVGAIRAAAARAAAVADGLTVVQLDAHADLRDSYGGSPLSHACAMRRALEGPPRPGRLVQVGVRSMCPEEIRFAAGRDDIKTFLAGDFLSGKATREEILSAIGPRVYLTIDMDVFDPSEAPAVGTPEPGGLRWADVAGLIEGIANAAEVVGVDVVELAPIPGLKAPEFFAAKLIYRILGLIHKSGK